MKFLVLPILIAASFPAFAKTTCIAACTYKSDFGLGHTNHTKSVIGAGEDLKQALDNAKAACGDAYNSPAKNDGVLFTEKDGSFDIRKACSVE